MFFHAIPADFLIAAWVPKMFADTCDLIFRDIWVSEYWWYPTSLGFPTNNKELHHLDDLGVPLQGFLEDLEASRLAASKTNNPSSTPRKSHATGAAVRGSWEVSEVLGVSEFLNLRSAVSLAPVAFLPEMIIHHKEI